MNDNSHDVAGQKLLAVEGTVSRAVVLVKQPCYILVRGREFASISRQSLRTYQYKLELAGQQGQVLDCVLGWI